MEFAYLGVFNVVGCWEERRKMGRWEGGFESSGIQIIWALFKYSPFGNCLLFIVVY